MQYGEKGDSFNQRNDAHVRDKQPFILFLHFFYPVDFQLTVLIHISTTALMFQTNKWRSFSTICWSINRN